MIASFFAPIGTTVCVSEVNVKYTLNYNMSQITTNVRQAHVSNFNEIGIVVAIGDGVAKINGLTTVKAGEQVVFESGTKGIALNLDRG